MFNFFTSGDLLERVDLKEKKEIWKSPWSPFLLNIHLIFTEQREEF